MSCIFKKGSLVPRRLGIILASKKKAQHRLVFGTDVIWDGKSLTPAQPMKWGEALIRIGNGMSAPRKNGTRQRSGFVMSLDWEVHSHYDSQSRVTCAKFVRKGKMESGQ